jgi:hypothetical protein
MDKIQYEKETTRLLNEALKLEEKAKLDLKTAEFFDREACKLESILEDEDTTDEQTFDAMLKLKALYNRIKIELNEPNSGAIRIERELLVLRNQAIIEGLI